MDPAQLLSSPPGTPSLHFLAVLRKTVSLVAVSIDQNKIAGPKMIPKAMTIVETHLHLKSLPQGQQMSAETYCYTCIQVSVLLTSSGPEASRCYLPAVSIPTGRSTTHLCGLVGQSKCSLP